MLATVVRGRVKDIATGDAEYNYLEANALGPGLDSPKARAKHTISKIAPAHLTKAAKIWPCCCRQLSALSSSLSEPQLRASEDIMVYREEMEGTKYVISCVHFY